MPVSNLVISGLRDLCQTFRYDALSREEFGWFARWQRTLRQHHGPSRYQPAINYLLIGWSCRQGLFSLGCAEGYEESVVQAMPHAWKAGSQTVLLQQQLKAMPDGGGLDIGTASALSLPARPL